MDRFTREDLRALLANRATPCVSLLMRTTRGVSLEDNVRWKNLLREAEEFLTGQGHRRAEAEGLLRPARDLSDNVPFWQRVSDGLAAFLAPGTFRTYRVPLPLQDRVVVAGPFHVKPLLPLLTGEGVFYALLLGPKGPRLLEGTADTVREVDLEMAPVLIPGALAAHRTHEALRDYFHRVDQGLRELLRDEAAPLVLAGPEDVLAAYRQVNGYRQLLSEGLVGDPDQLSAAQLRERAWELVRRHFREARGRAADLYRQLAGTGRTSCDLAEVVAEAYRGHVQYLFADGRQELWGAFDPATQQVQTHSRRQPDSEDLLNLAAAHVLAHRGTVYAAEPGDLPGAAPLAAVFWLPLGERSSKQLTPEAARV